MANFTDMPAEVLESIAAEVGGRILRRSVDNILLNRQWFDAARVTYHSGLQLESVRLYGCDIEKLGLDRRSFKHRMMMQKNTCFMSLRLLGHCHHEQVSGRVREQPWEEVGRSLSTWREQILTPVLIELFGDLRHLEQLQEVTLETVLDVEETLGPQLPYIRSSLVASFIHDLPIGASLRKLTLDLCSGIDYDEEDGRHLFGELSPFLHRIATVRLRLPMVCLLLFRFVANAARAEIQLKSFILKMHLPRSQNNPRHSPRNGSSMTSSQNPSQLFMPMVSAAKRYLADVASTRHPSDRPDGTSSCHKDDVCPDQGMVVFRISHVFGLTPMLLIADCISMETIEPEGAPNAYMGFGWPFWFEEEAIASRRWPLVLGRYQS